MEPDTTTPTPAPAPDDSLIGLIEQLMEPTEPSPISMVPQTWGWVVLALLLLVVLAYGIWRWIRFRRANAYRRAALHMLADAGDDPDRIASILRRTALAAYPRVAVASLSGSDWLKFLDDQVGGDAFSAGTGRRLATEPYRPTGPDPRLRPLAENWIRKHRRGATA